MPLGTPWRPRVRPSATTSHAQASEVLPPGLLTPHSTRGVRLPAALTLAKAPVHALLSTVVGSTTAQSTPRRVRVPQDVACQCRDLRSGAGAVQTGCKLSRSAGRIRARSGYFECQCCRAMPTVPEQVMAAVIALKHQCQCHHQHHPGFKVQSRYGSRGRGGTSRRSGRADPRPAADTEAPGVAGAGSAKSPHRRDATRSHRSNAINDEDSSPHRSRPRSR